MKCELCNRDLSNNEPVHRIRIGNARTYPLTKSVCVNCVQRDKWWSSKYYVWLPAEPCSRCERPVIIEQRRRKGLRHFACSRECQVAIWNAISRKRIKARRRPPTKKPCSVCDKPFVPKRSDAIYCSPSCKQRAYRQRESPYLSP